MFEHMSERGGSSDYMRVSMKQWIECLVREQCWDGYKAKGTKMNRWISLYLTVLRKLGGSGRKGLWDNIHAKRKRGDIPCQER